jgi:hypothetical protein
MSDNTPSITDDGKPIGYVVAMFNHVNGEVDDTLYSSELHSDRADAEFERDLRNDDAERTGQPERHMVCAVVRLPDDD